MSHNLDNNTIYEIFRSCRLCGAGGGYKMPIIPSVVGFDCADIELRQKIRECVQIEVNQDDKMPPLICELCVDKVNDFYEFLEMCRDTNNKTRQRLGLPDTYPQSLSEGDNCILGVTEPVYVQDEDDEPLSRRTTRTPVKIKNEEKKKKEKDRVKTLKKALENLIKQENNTSRESRSFRGENHLESSSSSRSSRNRRSPTPSRETRQTLTGDVTLISRLKEQQNNLKPIVILKREKEETISIESEDETEYHRPVVSKRTRERDLKDAPDKKIKLTIKLPRPPTPPKAKHRPGPKSSKRAETPPKAPRPPPPEPKSSKPGPKLSKTPSSIPISKPGPKSSKRTISPPPKPTKTHSTTPLTKPGPKSSKRTISPPPKYSKTPSTTPLTKPGPKSSKRTASPPPKPSKRVLSPLPPALEHSCSICASVFQSVQGYNNHMRTHTVKYTPNELSCNPCGEWFVTTDAATSHHKQHKNRNKPYKCRGCGSQHRLLNEYNQHIAETSCVPWTEVADVKCPECWKEYPTDNLRRQHRCGGKDARPGGKCSKCNRMYQTMKSRKKHESHCTSKKKAVDPLSGVKVSPSVRRRLLRARISLVRCDELVKRNKRGRYDVGNLAHDFGVQRGLVCPYRALSVRVKQEPLPADRMVSIHRDVRDAFYTEEDYVHWDSDDCASSGDDDPGQPRATRAEQATRAARATKRLPSLTALTLKTLFSRRCLGKVPRKLRKVRTEKFDSFFNPDTEFDNVQSDINLIIDHLADDDEETGFSLTDVKMTDVKTVREAVTDTDSINIDINGVNYESDSLIDDKQRSITDEGKVDNINENSNIQQIPNNLVHSIKNLMNADNGSETDASIDDNRSQRENDEKSTASEISQDLDIGTANNTDNLTNGVSLETEMALDKSNGTDLINDINELYDANIMEELDSQVARKQVNMADKEDKMLLEDLVPNSKTSVSGLDAISDEEFNFDA